MKRIKFFLFLLIFSQASIVNAGRMSEIQIQVMESIEDHFGLYQDEGIEIYNYQFTDSNLDLASFAIQARVYSLYTNTTFMCLVHIQQNNRSFYSLLTECERL